MAQNRRDSPATVRITSADISHEEESARRQRQYLILMGIRIVCFFAAFFTHGWIRWTCAAGMILIPWIAVIIANEIQRRRDSDTDHMLHAPPAEQLTREAQPPADDQDEVIHGEVIEESRDEEGGPHGDR